VLSSAEHLLNLINTVLDIAKIEAGRMDVQAANFHIDALADLCANTATPLLKPNVRLVKDIDPSLTIAHSDQDKIKQVILNLLSNAAKFTHEGQIVLQMRRVDADLVVNVTDSGIGISEEALGRIFEEFQQADTSTTREYGGTGLGLAISRNLAKLLGGDLTATSVAGKGSTFTLTAPLQYGSRPATGAGEEGAALAEAAPPARSQDGSKKLILVIDDDPDAVYLLQENLPQGEFEVVGARSGIEGQQKARDLKPHAVLLDIMMPDKDGWQVLHDLKADQETAAIPVVLLTIVDKKALGFRLGASAYLLKPLDPVAVLDALKQVTGGDGHKRVLVVDDDPHVADMLHQLLPESDFTLVSAVDGVAGLEAIEAHRPDVVLLDIMMPRLDGFGVIERLRANPETRDLPIIVISAKELTDSESARLKESVAFVMRKQGFDGTKLIHEINTALEIG
jgi:CheY-like chemotaxis protein/anti-sigma regulatory factor (Ser/Thr protein kinase)